MTEIEYLKQENKKLVKALDDYGNKNFKYKQALEEIQKILYECGCAKLNDIRLIINEVLNDRD